MRGLTPLRRKALRDALHLRGQLAAVVLVVASGVALFVTLRSMNGYLLASRDGYYASHRFPDVFAQVERAPERVAERVRELPGVAAVETRVVGEVLLRVPGLAEPATGRLVSIPPLPRPMLGALHLRSGRWPAPGADDEVVASDAFARANRLRVGDRLGAVVQGRWRSLRIAGTAISPEYVYEIRAGDIFPDNRRFGVLWMARPALAAALDREGAFDDLALTLAPGASEREVIARLDRLLARHGGRGAYGRDQHVSHRFLSDEIAETRVTSVLLPAIFLGVTAFLLHLVMSRLVALQRDQIAVLKAFGYGDGAIARHYLELALLPVGAGAALGTGTGVWLAGALAGVYARFFQFPAATSVADPAILAAGVLVAGGAALLGALGAVRRAVALPPAEAMHPEAPPRFRTSRLERGALGRHLPLPARIVLRHLHRRPLKAALGVFGTALAVAIVLAGAALWSAVAVMEEIHFERVQRQDVLVSLRDALAPAAVAGLAHLPGVVRVEPFRAVPVEVRNGHRHRRVVALVLPPDGQLWRVVDRRGRVRPLPLSGALLTRELAAVLGVGPGEPVTVAVLEGRRRTLAVPVAATADEMLGLTVYLDPGTARRLLGDGERSNGALIASDGEGEGALLARLAELPVVTGLAVRRSMLASFQATLAESFTISLGSLLAFACVIAGGIVYNGARVALSERGRELASLRVLGFGRGEVTHMLLGEQAALLLAALPLGVALGFGLVALVALRFATELYRMPLVLPLPAVVFACGVVVAAAVGSGALVRRRVRRLDLVAVLKTRE